MKAENYFQHIVSRLTLDEMDILGVLTDHDATATFKAMRKKEVYEKSGLTEANFRKVIYRLDAINFLETVTGNKEHLYYITNLGLMAVSQSLEGVVNLWANTFG